MGKPFWKSKTIAFNLAVAVVGGANEVAPILDQLVAGGYSGEWVAPVRAGLLLVNVVGNALLRTTTTQPVTLR
ncbi:hypothetical protein [Sagittula salina]|uniref:Uncharacterized protein n=1 Tax=Sagittula salina TaxID=2820268 RepID=A0A940MHK1_9RHOB|nr:hypothetical protein [Sagittula salina]MBP0481646.1 hypothetical protein [Sagittula salina]